MMKVRMLVLLDVLHELTDEEHILNSQSLVAELDKRGYSTDRRSVYRDVEALCEYGVDVVTTAKGFYLRNRRFTLAETMLMISAVQAAPFVTESKTNALMDKLMGFLSVYQREGIRSASNISGVKFGNEEVYRTIEMINYGIASKKKISFLYYKRSIMRRDVVQRRGKRYEVSPYAMVWVQDRYYLISNMSGKEEIVTLKNDSLKVELTTKGGKVAKATLLAYDAYNAKNVDVIDNDNDYGFILNGASQNFDTGKFFFTPNQVNDSVATMTIDLGNGAKWGIKYTLVHAQNGD